MIGLLVIGLELGAARLAANLVLLVVALSPFRAVTRAGLGGAEAILLAGTGPGAVIGTCSA